MILDIVVLVLVLISAAIAFLRGFIREALGIVTLVLALFAAYTFGPFLAPLMEGWLGVEQGAEPEKLFGVLPMDMVAQICSRGIIFLLVLIALSIATHIFAEFIKSVGMGAVDRSLGVVFGVVRAALLACILYLPIHFTVDEDTKVELFKDSITHYYVEKGTEGLLALMPEDMVKDKIGETQKAVNENEQVQTAREKLRQMDLLREDLTPAERAKLVSEKIESGELQKAFSEEEGYSEEFRDELNKLIEENVDGSESGNGVPQDYNQ
jgi:membrane protein required for colicin V production